MQVITSKDNESIKLIKKLKDKKYRDEQNSFLIEGLKIVAEAIEEKAEIKKIVVCEDCLKRNSIDKKVMYEIAKYDCIYVTETIFRSITDVTNPQGILAVVNRGATNFEVDFLQDLILVLDGIQDPGNLGTIIRTADSVGLKQIVLSNKCGDVYNPKVIRSTMGAIFRVKVIKSANIVDSLLKIKRNGFQIVSTELNTNENIYDIDYNKKAIVIGNEANGVSNEILEISDKKVKIPMLGKTESLNAGVATGIILYEYVRKKIL